MRLRLPILLSAVWFAVGASTTMAQTPTLDDLVQAAGNDMPHSLLQTSGIQAELALTDHQRGEFGRILHERATESRKLPRVFDLKELDEKAREQRTQAMRKLQDTSWNSSVAVLDDSQRTRLAQIYLQQMRERALEIPAVMESLKLSEEQKSKIEAVKTAFLAHARPSTSTEKLAREELLSRMKEAERRYAERNAAYLAILTAEQSAAFTAMQGKPFDLAKGLSVTRGSVDLSQLDVTLITQREIQKELNFTAEQTQQVADLTEGHRQARLAQAPAGLQPAAPADPESLKRTAKYWDDLKQVLTEKQVQRLTELTLQKRGPSTIHQPQIAKELKLTDEQRTQLRRIDFEFSELRTKRQEEQMQAMKAGNRVNIKQRLAEDRQLNSKRDADYLKVLTEEQRAAFEAMQGKKFTFPDPLERMRKALNREQKTEST